MALIHKIGALGIASIGTAICTAGASYYMSEPQLEKVAEVLEQKEEKLDWHLLGEPKKEVSQEDKDFKFETVYL